MSVWKFQLTPAQPGILGERFGIDSAMREVANEVDAALRYPFGFHKVNKLVIRLGDNGKQSKDYSEILGVGTKEYREFDLRGYRDLGDAAKIARLHSVIVDVFNWLVQSFEDSQCFEEALQRLNWSSEGHADGNPH